MGPWKDVSWAGDRLGWGNRNQLKRAEAQFPHTAGSLEVAPKASTAFMGSWLPPPSLQSAILRGSFGPHVWSPCGHAPAVPPPAFCPCPKQEKEKGKRSAPANPCPSTCSDFDPLLHDQHWASIIGLALASREAGKLDISNQARCHPQ